MRRTASLIVAALAAIALAGAAELHTRLDITTQPEHAQVFIDGQLQGTAPMQVFDLKPGRHLVRIQSPGYRTLDEYLFLKDGDFTQKNWALPHEKALFLLRSNPSDAEVRYNGVALGRTPFLSTTLNVGETYAFELVHNGYKTKKVSIHFNDRTPVVRDEDLMLDSGVVKCITNPSGATVLVNGVERGVTPLVADGVPKGLAMFTFRLKGYREESRELRLTAGEERNLEIALTPNPAKLKVVSNPEGARVFVDGDYQGKTPVEVPSLKPGRHELKLELAGHSVVSKTFLAGNGEEVTESIDLVNIMGRMQVLTIPGGVRISVDGRTVGTTKIRPGSERSDVLLLNNIPAGEHNIVAHLDGYRDVSRKVTVKSKQSSEVNIRMPRVFLADTEVETVHGTYRGMLVSASPDYIVIEIRPGITQTIRQVDVRKRKSLK